MLGQPLVICINYPE